MSKLWGKCYSLYNVKQTVGRMSTISDTKLELEDMHRQQAHGCCLCTNVKWADEGEASTAYFYNLERKLSQQCLFSAIRTLSGLIVHSFSLIAQAWVYFYSLLFTAQPLDVGEQAFFIRG